MGTRIFGTDIVVSLLEYDRVDPRDIRCNIIVRVRDIPIHIEPDIADRLECVLILMSYSVDLIVPFDETLAETALTIGREVYSLGSGQLYEDRSITEPESIEITLTDTHTCEPTRTTAECSICLLLRESSSHDPLSECISSIIDTTIEVESLIGSDDSSILSGIDKDRHQQEQYQSKYATRSQHRVIVSKMR